MIGPPQLRTVQFEFLDFGSEMQESSNFKGGIYYNSKHKLRWNRGSSVHRRVDDAARCQAVLRARRTGPGTRILTRRDYRGRKDDLARRADCVTAPGRRF